MLFTFNRPYIGLVLLYSCRLCFPKSILRASKVSIAGIMHLEINDADELLYFVSSERHKLLISG